MSADGKQLEALVAYIEETLLPSGFTVETNQRIFNDDGIQIAEFDVEIRGRIGSTDIAWLIECRDRPGAGPAPGSWIEQLYGRRSRFGFNKVTAVSTTGFSAGATEFASKEGIELREVAALTPDAFSSWLGVRQFEQLENLTNLAHAELIIDPSESDAKKEAAHRALAAHAAQPVVLRKSSNNEVTTLSAAFLGAVQGVGQLFDGLEPNGDPKRVRLRVRYINDDDHFLLETEEGPIRISEILFVGDLRVRQTLIPIAVTAEYRNTETGEVISQLATFESQDSNGRRFTFEMHHLGSSGETHILLRVGGGDT